LRLPLHLAALAFHLVPLLRLRAVHLALALTSGLAAALIHLVLPVHLLGLAPLLLLLLLGRLALPIRGGRLPSRFRPAALARRGARAFLPHRRASLLVLCPGTSAAALVHLAAAALHLAAAHLPA
jgi:hypothetical protein